jgi:hypothetical protein
MNKPQFNFGDIVKVNGYYPRLFEIDGRRTEHWQYANEDWTDVIYEVYDVVSCDWIECAEEDITLVAEAAKAEEYLAANPPDYEAPEKPLDTSDWAIDISKYFGGVTNMAKQERKPTARELSAMEADRRKAERKERGEQIDNLLDLRNWAAGMLEKTGNEAYGDRVFAIDAELKKLVETE